MTLWVNNDTEHVWHLANNNIIKSLDFLIMRVQNSVSIRNRHSSKREELLHKITRSSTNPTLQLLVSFLIKHVYGFDTLYFVAYNGIWLWQN